MPTGPAVRSAISCSRAGCGSAPTFALALPLHQCNLRSFAETGTRDLMGVRVRARMRRSVLVGHGRTGSRSVPSRAHIYCRNDIDAVPKPPVIRDVHRGSRTSKIHRAELSSQCQICLPPVRYPLAPLPALVEGLSEFRCNRVWIGHLLSGKIRPSNMRAKALSAGFHRTAHRCLPRPVGSSDRSAR